MRNAFSCPLEPELAMLLEYPVQYEPLSRDPC